MGRAAPCCWPDPAGRRAATCRFLRRTGASGCQPAGISQLLALGEQLAFELPRDERALQRRLGDLRLECQIDRATSLLVDRTQPLTEETARKALTIGTRADVKESISTALFDKDGIVRKFRMRAGESRLRAAGL